MWGVWSLCFQHAVLLARSARALCAWHRGTSGYLWALAGEEPALCGVATETRPPGFPVRVKR